MAVNHPCGALYVADAASDGLTGLYTPEGYIRVSIDQAGYGVYDSTGALRVNDATSETNPVGAQHVDGSMNMTFVDGDTLVTRYAANGSINAVDANSTPNLWTPLSDEDLYLWADPSDIDTITEVSGSVSQVDDKGPNGHHLVQGSASAQLTTGTRTLNGQNVLDGDGGDYLSVSVSDFPSTVMIAIVAEIDVIDAGFDSLYMADGASGFTLRALSSTQFDGQVQGLGTIGFANKNLSGGPFPGPSIYITVFDFSSGNVFCYVDGVERASPNSGYTGALSASQNLYYFSRLGLQQPNGGVGDFVIISNATTDSRQKLEGYLADKYNIALVSGHPYENSPPNE